MRQAPKPKPKHFKPYHLFLADRPLCTKFPKLKCAHILFWLNPTGHSKFHNIITTLCLLPIFSDCLYFLVPASAGDPPPPPPPYPLPLFFPVPDRGWQACSTSLLWMCTLNTQIRSSTVTSPDGSVVKSSATGLEGIGFVSWYRLQSGEFLKAQWVRVRALHLLFFP